jgi:hypothetical protein
MIAMRFGRCPYVAHRAKKFSLDVNPPEGVLNARAFPRMPRGPITKMMLWMLLVVSICFALDGCVTREEAARRAGRKAAVAGARACADAGDVGACLASFCREICDEFAGSRSLGEACVTRCAGEGTCDSDADCAAGLACVMIAPRVRRCSTPPSSTP